MSGFLERAADYFLVPETTAGPAPATVPSEARTVVLGHRDDALPLAASVALALRAADPGPTAVVAVWTAGEDDPLPRGPATPAASRLAARLSRRELPSVPRGRLVWLRLPSEPASVAPAVRRAAAAIDGPLVVALAGSRPAALDDLVADHDLVLVAAEPTTPLAAAALARLSDTCVSALACRPLPRGPARALALAGLAVPRLDPPLRAARTETQ